MGSLLLAGSTVFEAFEHLLAPGVLTLLSTALCNIHGCPLLIGEILCKITAVFECGQGFQVAHDIIK
jgi:hypothetical protein